MKVFPLSCTLQISVRCLSRDGRNETSHKTYRTRELERLWKCHAYDSDWGSRRKTTKKRDEKEKSLKMFSFHCQDAEHIINLFLFFAAALPKSTWLLISCAGWMNLLEIGFRPTTWSLESFFLVIFALPFLRTHQKFPPVRHNFNELVANSRKITFGDHKKKQVRKHWVRSSTVTVVPSTSITR